LQGHVKKTIVLHRTLPACLVHTCPSQLELIGTQRWSAFLGKGASHSRCILHNS
jgi:hypothetical protein